MNNNKNKTAFSLIELSMVVTIIAILVGVLIIGGSKLAANARLATAQNQSAASPVSSIPGLVLWLDATSADAFIKTELNSSTKAISTWYDVNRQSNSQSNATQATSGNRPIYTSNAINGLPALKFGANSSDGMVINNLSLNDNYTIFAVFNTIGSTSVGRRAIQGQVTDFIIGPHNGVVRYYALGTTVSDSLAAVTGKFYEATAVRSTAASAFYVNGSNYTVNSAVTTSPGTIALGAGSGNVNEPLNGYIGEVIIYNTNLSDNDRQDIENYLIKKWKIS